MKKMRLIQPSIAIPKYRQLRLPTVAAEFSPYMDVEINDENIEPLDFSPVDCIGITCQTYNAYRAFYISEQFRKQGVKTILGGVFATAMPQEASKYFDSVVMGEVEGLGHEIISDLNNGSLKKVYQHQKPPDLSKTNLPRFDLLKNEKYYHFNFPIETSRGCPHRCNFCFNKYQYPTFRTRSLRDIERDLGQHDHGIIEVIDLHFAGNKRFLFEVCEVFQSMNVISWFGEATILSLDDEETVKHLADSHCRMVFVGLESISKNTLAGVNKSFNDVGQYQRIIHMCQDYGIYIHSGFIWGLEGQDLSTFDETLKFCEKTKIYLAGSNLLTYFPGTAIYHQMKKTNTIIEDNYQYFDSAHLITQPKTLSSEKILDGVTYFNQSFYSVRSMLKRAFQHPNNNLMLLFDFFGFNIVYRSYYKSWLKKVKQGIDLTEQQQKNSHDKILDNLTDNNSQPILYNNIPLTYSIFDYIWRYYDFWFQKWYKPTQPASIEFMSQALIFYIISIVLASGIPSEFSLMNQSPSIFRLLFNYYMLWGSTSMVAYVIAGRVKSQKISFFMGLLSLSPVIYFPFNGTESGFSIMTLFAMINCIYLLKIFSFYFSPMRIHSSYVKFYAFLFMSPSLIFENDFSLDFKNNTIIKSLSFMCLGTIQLLLAIIVFAGIGYLFSFSLHMNNCLTIDFWLITTLKCIYCYLVFAGMMNIIDGYWKMWGYKRESTVNVPLLSRSPGIFWKKINREYHQWALTYMVQPLKELKHASLILSTLFPFILIAFFTIYIFWISGIPLCHCDAVNPIFQGIPWILLCFVFFFINGLMVYLEKKVSRPKRLQSQNCFVQFFQVTMTFICLIWISSVIFEISDRLIILSF